MKPDSILDLIETQVIFHTPQQRDQTDHYHFQKLLSNLTNYYPDLWQVIDNIRRDKGVGIKDWNDSCYLPMFTIWGLTQHYDKYDMAKYKISDTERMTAMAAWRYTQGIYEFEENIYNSICKATIPENIPLDIFYHLPQWCVYIKTKKYPQMRGFFAHLDHDISKDTHQLKLLVDLDIFDNVLPLSIEIGDWSINEGLKKVFDNPIYELSENPLSIEEKKIQFDSTLPIVKHCLSLVMYLCSEKPDIQGIENEYPTLPAFTKTKKGLKLFPPSKPKVWSVGKRLEKNITAYKEPTGKTHKYHKPHIRSAHWHGYWTGKRGSASRKFILKWLQAMVINAKFH